MEGGDDDDAAAAALLRPFMTRVVSAAMTEDSARRPGGHAHTLTHCSNLLFCRRAPWSRTPSREEARMRALL
ncbi:hypothetical protein CBOM_07502 [Ceraceosorus bombacis]|uniref:Uncharacterized protein n=1 Tax=Ceraceosorus bombacis TaxID=401625 RepID=A0A0P1BD41_9BASI|nr:hypothetical protein CBOM_07502 [Ceraceosorus bombacis]